MSASWRTSDLTVLAVAGVGTVLLTGASFLVAPPDSLPRNDGSSYAAHPDGARAAYRVLLGLGYDVDRSFEPVAAIRHAPERTVLVLASPSEAPSEQDVKALRAFLEKGGRVLATGPAAATFLPDMFSRQPDLSSRQPDMPSKQPGVPAKQPGVPARNTKAANPPDPRLARARRQDRALPGAMTDAVESVEMSASPSPLPADSPYVVVYGTEQAPAVLSARVEKGEAVWWASSAPLANGAIGRPKHVELLVNTLGPPGARTILWDEFYHGHTRSFWSYLSATPFFAAMVQVLAIVSLALFTYARRRRPIRARVVEPRTSPLEFIDTMGGLYERARASAAAVATVYANVRRTLLTALGLPLTTDDERMVAAAVDRLAFDRVELSSTLSAARAAASDLDLTARQAAPLVAELQGLAARVEGVRRGQKRR
jgi:hypothetical protein